MLTYGQVERFHPEKEGRGEKQKTKRVLSKDKGTKRRFQRRVQAQGRSETAVRHGKIIIKKP